MKQLMCKEEYNSLKNEMVTRINIVNNQSNSAILALIASWTVAISFTIFLYGKDASAIVFREGIDFLSTILFIIPVCFFVPLAIKSGENLIQIASIASYIKVFYEFPSINSNKEKMLWELTNSYCNYAIVDHGKESRLYFAYNSEYTILSMFSTIIYGFRATLSIANTNMNMDRSAIILHVIIISLHSLIFVACLICCIIIIHRSSSTRTTVKKRIEELTIKYLDIAIDYQIIAKERRDEALEKLSPHKYEQFFRDYDKRTGTTAHNA